ncbi:helix-turn-helix domain-containing protein [Streptomyces tubbatahanensis]|uniref:Helix-turn-helix domain-containing protein n=1 Tax=Streptomyces tubbatahanensis TaxID=2923272 RepID=A0ABY3XYP2_9ACTN|nr:helix-turn-helix domain-containing protein [Streptomyces tubbatahanensis]UNS99471.1 helix-turn-helix domain-containing protein [Streptomyces tubbatahanensis]
MPGTTPPHGEHTPSASFHGSPFPHSGHGAAEPPPSVHTDPSLGAPSVHADPSLGAPSGAENEHQGDSPTLASLLATGAGEALELIRAPLGSGVPVRGVGVFDSGETLAARGQVLIAPGVDDSSDAAPLMLRSAARAGAVAVVVRRGASGPTRRLLEVADETSTALLTRTPWVEWTELIGMLRAGLAHRGGPAGPESLSDVPLGDLSALARALAELVGGAVTLEDPESRVLAFSPTENGADPLRRLTILGQQVPRWRLDELAASGFLRTLWSTDDVVHRPAEERFSERLAIAVRAGEEVLGSIWAAADGSPLPSDARQALREAARVAAPHLLHHRLSARNGSSRRRQAVRALLEGTGDARSAAATLGLDLGTPCAVLSVTTGGATADGTADGTAVRPAADSRTDGTITTGGDTTTDGTAEAATHERALRLASLQVTAHQPAGYAQRSQGRLDVLLPLPGERPQQAHGPTARADTARAGDQPREGDVRARRLALQLAGAVREAGARPLVAIGPAPTDLAQAPDSLERAHLVLRVLLERPARAGGLEVADESDVRAAMDAMRVVRAVEALTPAVDGPVRELLAHDAEHRTDLAPTLAAYLSRFGDVAGTARQLGIHPNTLRYRLRRLRTHFALDLDDPDVRLLAELGLRAAGLHPAAAGGPGRGTETEA